MFGILFPAAQKYQHDARTRDLLIPADKAREFLISFDAIESHYREYRELADILGHEPTEEWWGDLLRSAFAGRVEGATVSTALDFLDAAARSGSDTREPNEEAAEFIRSRVEAVVRDGTNSIIGRYVLANMWFHGVSAEDVGLDPRVEGYLGRKDENVRLAYCVRLRTAHLLLDRLESVFDTYEHDEPIRLADLLAVFLWWGRKETVEMVLPNLIGATLPAIRPLGKLFEYAKEKTGVDYTNPPLAEMRRALNELKAMFATFSLRDWGRLALVSDIASAHWAGQEGAGKSGGNAIRQLLRSFFPGAEGAQTLREAWGHESLYVPDANDFPRFCEDVGNVLYQASVTERDRELESTLGPDRELADQLQELARETLEVKGHEELQFVIERRGDVINRLVERWERRFPDSERLAIARYVQTAFGLGDSVKPVPIPLDEIAEGFAGSHYDERKHVYHLRYQEANDYFERDINLPARLHGKHAPRPEVTYCTALPDDAPRFSPEGIPYSAWLEVSLGPKDRAPIVIPVVGRGSVEPFGEVDNPHAGLVIGAGCAVEHAALAIALAELAALGAGREALQGVADEFIALNPGKHGRADFAHFQVEQTIAAFTRTNGQPYTIAEHLGRFPQLLRNPRRPHLRQYVQPGVKPIVWACRRAAHLRFLYRDIYTSNTHARRFWYENGVDARIPGAVAHVFERVTAGVSRARGPEPERVRAGMARAA